MDPANRDKQDITPSAPRYLSFPHLEPGVTYDNGTKPALNKFSSTLTKNHELPAAQAMLYAAGVPDARSMAQDPHVGIASVWWEGNPCNMHLLDLSKAARDAVAKLGMLPWQYNTVGVSDGITMGGEYSRTSPILQGECIADAHFA